MQGRAEASSLGSYPRGRQFESDPCDQLKDKRMKNAITQIKSGQRDPFVVAMRMRKSGAHGKTGKANRRADKMKLKRELSKNV